MSSIASLIEHIEYIEYDVVIVGGGLIGASLLLALNNLKAERGLKIALIEPKNITSSKTSDSNQIAVQTAVLDQRSLVLNLGSKLYYEQLGVWEELHDLTTPVNKIIVSEQGSFSKIFLDNRKLQVDALGYVVNIDLLSQTIWQRLNNSFNNQQKNKHQIDVLSPYKVTDLNIRADYAELLLTSEAGILKTLQAKIIIAADGGRSYMRDLLKITHQAHDYKQTAIIANLTHEFENKNTAFERFSEQGPCALLPRTAKTDSDSQFFSGVVWPWPSDQIAYIKSLSKQEILNKLQKLFGYKLGKFLDIGELQFFPLWRITSDQLFKDRVVLLGNAANHIHPIGGQGFNLGLRDVKYFTDQLQKSITKLQINNFSLEQINHVFEKYVDLRVDDHRTLQNHTHGLLNLFDSRNQFISAARRLGMAVCNNSHLLTNLIANQSMGLNI